jgi:hypothetical protein
MRLLTRVSDYGLMMSHHDIHPDQPKKENVF